MGVGQQTPDFTHSIAMPSGCMMPSGPVISYAQFQPASPLRPSLAMNEYIVYQPDQVCIRFLVCVGPPRKRSTDQPRSD
jgi:hypothetical protein